MNAMPYPHIDVKPMTGSLGAEIFGVDLGQPLSPEQLADIRQALLDHLVIFFRDQDITPAQHITFGRHFGELHIHPFIPSLEGYPEILQLGGKQPGPGKYSRNANVWHTDLTYSQDPPMGSILHGLEVPEAGGDTMFANLYAAYEGLSDRIQHLLSDMVAVHSVTQTKTVHELSSVEELKQLTWAMEAVPPAEHPVIRVHEETGRKALFVNSNFTAFLKDVSEHESNALLAMLNEHINHPEYQCRFRWRKYSLAFWDNRCTQHYALADYATMRRMHRVTVCGERPAA